LNALHNHRVLKYFLPILVFKKKKAASGRRWMPPFILDRLREEERTDLV